MISDVEEATRTKYKGVVGDQSVSGFTQQKFQHSVEIVLTTFVILITPNLYQVFGFESFVFLLFTAHNRCPIPVHVISHEYFAQHIISHLSIS